MLILLSKDIVEEELQKKKDSECEPEDKMIETNAEEKEKEKKPEQTKPNLCINTTHKPKVRNLLRMN